MIINSNGTNILQTLPKPSSRFLWDMNHTMNHPTSMEIAIIGIKFKIPLKEFVDCSRLTFKNVLGSAPQLKKAHEEIDSIPTDDCGVVYCHYEYNNRQNPSVKLKFRFKFSYGFCK